MSAAIITNEKPGIVSFIRGRKDPTVFVSGRVDDAIKEARAKTDPMSGRSTLIVCPRRDADLLEHRLKQSEADGTWGKVGTAGFRGFGWTVYWYVNMPHWAEAKVLRDLLDSFKVLFYDRSCGKTVVGKVKEWVNGRRLTGGQFPVMVYDRRFVLVNNARETIFFDCGSQEVAQELYRYVTETRQPIEKPASVKNTVADVLAERGKRYGLFSGHAKIAQTLKRAMHETAGWQKLTDVQREALDMIQHKIARMLNGDPTYVDNATDITGYGRLMLESMETKAA